MKKLKKHTAHSKRNRRRKTNESGWYFINGKWITAEERETEIARNELKISQIEEKRAEIKRQIWNAFDKLSTRITVAFVVARFPDCLLRHFKRALEFPAAHPCKAP